MASSRDGIVIKFLSDLQDFLTGKNRAKDELKDLERGIDGVKDASDAQATATEDGFRDVEQAAKDAGTAAGDLADGVDDVGTATDGLKDKGSDALEGLKGGFLALAGVAGGVAGIVQQAFGAAVDFVKGKFEEQQKAAAELKESLVGAYRAAAEEGNRYLETAQLIANATDIINDPSRRKKAEADASTIGVDTNTYIRALAGDYEALQVVIEQTKRAEEERREAGASNTQERAESLAEKNRIAAIQRQLDLLKQAHEEGQANAEQTIAVASELEAAELSRIQKTRDADQARYEAAAANLAALQETKVSVPVEFDVDKSKVERYIADLKARKIPIVADVVDRYGKELP